MQTTGEDGDDDELGDALAAMRPTQDDVFARALQDSVRRALVGADPEPFRLGRFTVLNPIGGGGMGTVFVAYDPDLDRKIALKVLHVAGERGRRDVLREGRALARLRHPNVVAVYELGVVDEQLFVAMEYVAGVNLREWLTEARTQEAVLARLVEAGRGLVAAHAVELVHRDVKPENLVIGRDGHTRVIDFGLARPLEELRPTAPQLAGPAAPRSIHAGTPAYMAPERLAGAAGDARADQYAFCVTAWEALLGARPPDEVAERRIPGWLRRALERGLAADPAQRWPSMAQLLAALERGRTRARMRRAGLAIAGLTAVLGAAVGVHHFESARQAEARRQEIADHEAACDAAGAAVDRIWGDAARQKIRDAFAATGVGFAGEAAETLMPWLAERRDRWRRARAEACRSADPLLGGAWSPEDLESATLCLEDRLLELERLLEAFTRANEAVVRKAVTIAAEPDRVDACMDVDQLRRWPSPPEDGRQILREVRAELAEATADEVAGRYGDALSRTTAARERVEATIQWPPLWAAARAHEGTFLESTGDYEAAAAASADAYFAAAQAGAWDVAADAATRLVSTVGAVQARHEDGRAWGRHAELAIALAGDRDQLRRAALLNNLARIDFSARAFAGSRALFEETLAIQERELGPDHPSLAKTLNSLGNTRIETGEYAEAKPFLERALAIKEKALGPDHPDVANSLNSLAGLHSSMGERAAAKATFERALAIFEAALGPDHPSVAMTLDNLASLANTGGDPETALRQRQRALAIRERALGPAHPEVATSLLNLGNVYRAQKKYPEALAHYERALAIEEEARGPGNPEIAKILNNLAIVHESMGALEKARPLLERSIALIEASLGREHPFVAISLYNLARNHMSQRRPREAIALLERATSILDARAGVQPGEFESHLELARAIVAAGGDRARAIAEATRAREGFAAAGPSAASSLADAEAWLAKVRPTK